MAETHPYWEKLTSDDIQMIMKLPSVDVMTFDLGRGIGVMVSFYWKPIGRYAKELRNFTKEHPEFKQIIETILAFDTDAIDTMNIHFHQITEKNVKTTLIPSLKRCRCDGCTANDILCKAPVEDGISLTFEQACAFIHVVNGMVNFLTCDGEITLA